MTADLVFYTNPHSRGRIVRWMLEETARPYTTKVLEFGAPMKTPEYLAINPMGKVPALQHGTTIITETPAILAYLADAFPQAGLAPPVSARGAYYRWLFFTAGPLDAALGIKALDITPSKEKQGMLGFGTYDLAVNTIAAAVAQSTYIAGDQFSAADIYIASYLGFGLQFKSLPDRPEFMDYIARCSDRPAYRRACEIDDGLIAAGQ